MTPEIGLECASSSVIVTLEVVAPSATMEVVPVIVEVFAAEPGVNETVPPDKLIGEVMERVLLSATVDESVHVETPVLALELEHAVIVFPLLVLVAANVGVIPPTATLLASFNVIVMVEVATPSAMTGPVPVMVECAEDTAPGANTTVPPVTLTGLVIESVLVSATVEASVQLETPLAALEEQVP